MRYTLHTHQSPALLVDEHGVAVGAIETVATEYDAIVDDLRLANLLHELDDLTVVTACACAQ